MTAKHLQGLEFPAFRPSRLLRNAHAMTLALGLPRRRGEIAGDEVVDVPVDVDGSRVRLLCRWATDLDAPTLVLVHGFTGSAASGYMVGCARKAAARGWTVVRMQTRGSGGTEHLGRPLSHVGLTSDLDAVLAHVARRGGVGRIYLAGFSMGGNLALKLAGEWGRDRPVDLRGVVVVSPSIDIDRCARECDERPRLRIYRNSFVRALRRMLARHTTHYGLSISIREVRAMRTMRHYDELYTVPMWGFGSVERYWAEASAIPVLQNIELPTLVLASRDDVLVPFESLEPLHRIPHPYLRFVATEAGGHCSFVSGRRLRRGDPDPFWAENRILQFVEELESAPSRVA